MADHPLDRLTNEICEIWRTDETHAFPIPRYKHALSSVAFPPPFPHLLMQNRDRWSRGQERSSRSEVLGTSVRMPSLCIFPPARHDAAGRRRHNSRIIVRPVLSRRRKKKDVVTTSRYSRKGKWNINVPIQIKCGTPRVLNFICKSDTYVRAIHTRYMRTYAQ